MNKLIILLAVLFLITPTLAHAQTSGLSATPVYEISDKEAIDGDILILNGNGLKRADSSDCTDMFGVLEKDALVSLDNGNGDEQPVITSGTAFVNVTTANGPIKKGDRIAASTIIGKGQKATSTHVLGVALADFNEPKDKVGQIPVAVKIEYIGMNTANSSAQLFGVMGASLFKDVQDPKNFGQVLRFFAAGLAILAGFLTSFFLFSKSVPKSIDAIARNPLAQKSIYFVTWMNIALAIAVTLVGVGAAFLILKF